MAMVSRPISRNSPCMGLKAGQCGPYVLRLQMDAFICTTTQSQYSEAFRLNGECSAFVRNVLDVNDHCAFHTAAVGSKCSTSWSGLIHKAPWIVVRLAYSSKSVDAKVLMWCYVSRLGRNAMTNGSQRAASLRPSSILYVHTYWAPEAGIRPNRCSALLHAPQGITYHTFHIIAHKRCQTSQMRHRSSRPHTASIYTHPNSGGWWCLGAEMRLARTQPITFRPNAPRR